MSKEIEFIAISNIHSRNFEKLLEIGIEGLPSPSIQISIANEDLEYDSPIHDFGDISFIFNKENIFGMHSTIPKNDATHNIFAGDAYTLRFPSVEFSQHIKERNKLLKELYKVNGRKNAIYSDPITEQIQKNWKLDTIEKARKSFLFKLLYLERYDLADEFKPKYKKEKISEAYNHELRVIFKSFDYAQAEKNPTTYLSDYILKKVASAKSNFSKKRMKENFLDENENPSAIKFAEYYKNEIKLAKGKGKILLDKDTTSKRLNALVRKANKISGKTFNSFINEELNKIYHSPKIADTRIEANLDNIVAYMKRNRGTGSEQENFSSVMKKNAAKNIVKIRSVEEMHEKIDILRGSNLKPQCHISLFYSLSEKSEGKYSHDILHEEILPETLASIKYSDSISDINMKLEKIGIVGVSDSIIQKVKDLALEHRSLNQRYYEAKPNKGFLFHHSDYENDKNIVGVVIPKDTPKHILDYLKKTDMRIVRYDSNDKSSRLAAINKFKSSFITKPKKKRTNRLTKK